MKKILLLGSYGQTNLGDDLLMYNYLSFLRDRGYEQIYANAVRPDLIPKVIYEEFPELKIVETYKTSTSDWIKILREVEAAVYGGGTIYKEMYASTGRNKHGVTLRMMGFNNLARLLKVPVYNLNIGTGSIKTGLGRGISRQGLMASRYTVFRDQKSYDYATEMLSIPKSKACASTDGLFLNHKWEKIWHEKPLKNLKKGRPTVGLNMLSDIPDWIDRPHYVKAMRDLVDQLSADYNVVLIPFQHDFSDNNDYVFMQQEIVPQLKAKTGWQLLPRVEIDDVSSILAQCDVVLGMRFHSLLLATAINTPFVSLAYDTKCARFVEESGYPHIVKLEEITVPRILKELHEALKNKVQLKKQLKQIATTHYQEAEECLRKIEL